MQKTTYAIAFLICFFFAHNSLGQSFEETNIPGLTTIPSASRSANFIDVNNDGWDDVFITNGPASGANNMLLLNNQNGSFTTVTVDDIVTDNDRSDGASFADADNDGDLDAMVVTFGANGTGKINYFYRNNGDGTFNHEPSIAMGLPLTYSEMVTWIDVNNDQNLDVYVTNSVQNLKNLYFENLGDGNFQERSDLAITNEQRPSRSVDWIDFDNDGDCDLYITNEGNQTNSLFRNDGANNFTPINNDVIVLDFNNSAGSSWGDIDNDGDFDLFVANYATNGEANQLYFNNDGVFAEDTSSIVNSPITNSFGSSFGDVDNDGDLDLLVCNAYLSSQNTNFLYLNDGAGNFSLDTSSNLANHTGWTFGAAFGDYDNDGWLDVLLANNLNDNQSNSLFRNTGTGNNWVKLNCQGIMSNTSAVGATVKLKATINGETVWQTRKITASSGYCSQNSYTVHFGLGDATTIEELKVEWPFGTTETFTEIDINEIHPIIEGEGTIGLSEFNLAQFYVFPNPVKNYLYLNHSNTISNSDLQIEIYTISGQLLQKKNLHHPSKNTSNLFLDVSLLASGQYTFIIYQDRAKIGSGKFIKTN